jgi:alkanesulfonate monooxygenase SsuD/methylene tetrahydromethanopterin reductase-like flavin-dependent oxidoreductase (luciferase family)
MQIWLFDIMQWPYRQWEIPYPFPGSMYDRALGRELYQGHLALYRRADELGYDGVCFAEHHSGTTSVDPSPNLMAAAVATHTENAKIVVLGNCLPMHGHPVRVAEELAMVDVLSGGRLVSGFIRGGGHEFQAYGIDITRGRKMFEESWELIVKAWTEPEPFAWHGEYYDYDVVSILPRPIQQPHPPIIAAANTAESIEWAARHHVPLITSCSPTYPIAQTFDYYRKYAREECGWDPTPEYCGVSRQVYVSDSDAQAREEVEAHAYHFYHQLSASVSRSDIAALHTARHSERSFDYKSEPHRAMPKGADAEYDGVMRDGYLIAGSPDTVTRLIQEQQKALGVGIFLTYLPFGTMEPPQAMKSLELFAREVMPTLKRESEAGIAAAASS